MESKIIEEYSRRNTDDSVESHMAMVVIHKKQAHSAECYFCHKKGHLKKNFLKYNEWKRRQQQKSNTIRSGDFCLVATENRGNWIIDLGTSCHICIDHKLFINPEKGKRK